MVAYSFQRRFIEPIRAGTKRNTVRDHRKRHARIGEKLQLYAGMRTKQCELIGRTTCTGISAISIDITNQLIQLRHIQGNVPQWLCELVVGDFEGPTGYATPDDFARGDGFENWLDFATLWMKLHPDALQFSGVLIQWGDLE